MKRSVGMRRRAVAVRLVATARNVDRSVLGNSSPLKAPMHPSSRPALGWQPSICPSRLLPICPPAAKLPSPYPMLGTRPARSFPRQRQRFAPGSSPANVQKKLISGQERPLLSTITSSSSPHLLQVVAVPWRTRDFLTLLLELRSDERTVILHFWLDPTTGKDVGTLRDSKRYGPDERAEHCPAPTCFQRRRATLRTSPVYIATDLTDKDIIASS